MNKAALRSSVRARRMARPIADRQAAAQAIAARALGFLPGDAERITCYSSLPGEPGTGPLIEGLLERGLRVWLPRLTGRHLTWVLVDRGTSYADGPMGIHEPLGEAVESPAVADVMLMPALAVDAMGRRLGQGGGYYDRALASVPPLADGGPMLVALVHDDEVVDDVPSEPHDRRVDVVITPSRTLTVG